MSKGRIIIVTGSPGTGKSTLSAILAVESPLEKSVHLQTDDFYRYLSKGYVQPHLPEANAQNTVVIEAFLACAKRFYDGGYEVIVDGIVGPWFLSPWLELARDGYETHYLVLRASKAETLNRATERTKLDKLKNVELVNTMWEQFTKLGFYEANVVEISQLSLQDSVREIRQRIETKACLLA